MSRKGKNNSIASWTICTIAFACALLPTMRATAANGKPDNAALLYYQALLLCPDLDSIPGEAIDNVFGSVLLQSTTATGSVEQARKYVKDHKLAIQIAESASKISHCDWALPYAPYGGGSEQGLKVSRQAKVLAFLIGAEARILADDGDYRAGFARCLMLCRIARHFAKWQGSPLAKVLEGTALRCVRQLLHEVPPDENTLRWLSDQFAAKPPVTAPLSIVTKKDFECMFSGLRKRLRYSRMRERFAEEASNEKQRNDAMNLTDDEVLDLIRQTTAEFLDPALETLAGDMPYALKYERIRSLVKEFEELRKTNPGVTISTFAHAERVLTSYNNDVMYRTIENGLKAAVEIYYLRATTGRLPEAIPDGLPKDAYSDQDFEYEITDDGFLLRCRAKDLAYDKTHCFAYKVQGK